MEKDNDDSPHLDRDTRYSLSHVGWFVALGMAAFDSSDRAPEPIKPDARELVARLLGELANLEDAHLKPQRSRSQSPGQQR